MGHGRSRSDEGEQHRACNCGPASQKKRGAEKFKAARNKAKPLAPTDHRKKTHHALRTCELESASDTEKKSGRNARYSPNGAV
jgi:hypothetical protein